MKKLLFALALSLVATSFSFPPEYRYIDIYPLHLADPQEYVMLQGFAHETSLTVEYVKCGEVTTCLYPDALQNVPRDEYTFLEFKDFLGSELGGVHLRAYHVMHDAGPCVYVAYKDGGPYSTHLFTRDANNNFVKLTKEKFLTLVDTAFEPILAQPIEELVYHASEETQDSVPVVPFIEALLPAASGMWTELKSFTADFFNDLLGEE